MFSRGCRLDRMARGNSFVAGFGTTCGVLFALVLAVSIFVIVERTRPRQHVIDPKMAASAKAYAMQALKHHDMLALGREAFAAEVDGEWCVSGPAVGRDNRVHDVFVSFRVATVGKTKRWQLETLNIDGDAVVVDGTAFD